jgi:peptide/nickel transport system permease protein
MLLLLTLFVFLGPYVYTVDPKHIDILAANAPPSAEHPFGTDDLGRDMLARCIYGGRISLTVGFTAMLIAMFLGTTVGLVAGYFKRLDNLLMRFTDLMLTLPALPILLVAAALFRDPLRAAFGLEAGAFIMIVTVIGVLGWMSTSRLVRGSVLSVKQKEFVEAAVNVGVQSNNILVRHILPNVVGVIIVSATLAVAAAVLTESTLSFLGVGFPPDVPTWGSLLYAGRNFMTQFPWVVIFPGVLISLTILSINFMGDGLRDALDPRQRR